MEKIWKPLLDNYDISSDGEIYSRKYKRLLSPWLSGKGYVKIDLGRNVRDYIHRLVAETFIDNPENKPTVNHKNHNKLDNRVENLEWMTYKEQTADDIRLGLRGIENGPNGKYRKINETKETFDLKKI